MGEKRKERILALLLSTAVLLGMTMPLAARAKTPVAPSEGQIQSFLALTDNSTEREVPQGTAWEELNLPGELEAMVFRVQEEPAENGGETSAPSAENVPVTWESGPAYDSEKPGEYVLTPKPGEGYTVPKEVSLPRITVRVKAAQTNSALKSAPAPQPASAGTALTVEVTGNGSDAVKNAVEAELGGSNKADYTAIILTGSASELTEDNWNYIRALYAEDSEWNSLTTLDLSGMSRLSKVETLNSQRSPAKLIAVTFPSSLKTIGMDAFYGSTGLTEVTFPSSLETIGVNAFLSCGSLKETAFPNNLKSIEAYAFSGCFSLRSVTFSSSLETIGSCAFSDCISLTEVTFPSKLKTIVKNAFSGCTSLTAFAVVSENPYFTGKAGVLYDKKMETLLLYPQGKTDMSFTIPDGVVTIGNAAFGSQPSLESVTFPSSLKTIEGYAFGNCTGLTEVTFPNNLESIGGNAFYNCLCLTEVTFSKNLTSIGSSAFHSCESLATLTFTGSTPPNIGPAAFNNIAGGGRLYYPSDAPGYDAAWISGLKLPAGGGWSSGVYNLVVEVDNDAPGEVADKVTTALGGGNKADYTAITLTGDATELTGDNWDYLRNLYKTNSDWTNLTTLDLSEMDGLIKVGGSGGNNIGRLTTVIFPDKLKTIGSNAFYGCGSLKNAVFPDGLRSIEGGAFGGCRSLAAAVFPSSLQTIGSYAFSGCRGLTEVTLPKNLETVGDFAFSECASMKSFTVADGNGYFSSENGVLYDKKMETLLIYPIGNTDTSFAVPDGVRTIKRSAFYNCPSLTKVIFPDSLETIENAAFFYCSGLASLTFTGDSPPNVIAGDALYSIAGRGAIYYPAGKESNYNDTWRSGLSTPVSFDGWTLVPGYRLTVDGGTDTTKGGLYQENDSVSLTAAPSAGRQFDQWTSSGGGAFANAEEPSTTFTMPAAHVTVTAHFTPSYSERTLRDPSTGVTVRGSLTEDAVLNVKPGTLHAGDADPACDAIRAYGKENGGPLLLYDISLSTGEVQGEVDVTIPVGTGYNGRTAAVMHCHRRELERISVPVENGAVKGTFGGLSPFAVFIPGSETGGSSGTGPAGGAGSSGSGVRTGDPFDPVTVALIMLASLAVCASMVFSRKRRCAKRHR
ncbi:leucine-rich repeat protein [[Clostridium] hylemonae]|uniref:leucine-rich repeat protein n=1 Tax=[Clostridium] hylemonae TaxID=89153 RepID=UPI00110632BA|nr:leucine-rich repeat protein [[Clostridium] hylemonae]